MTSDLEIAEFISAVWRERDVNHGAKMSESLRSEWNRLKAKGAVDDFVCMSNDVVRLTKKLLGRRLRKKFLGGTRCGWASVSYSEIYWRDGIKDLPCLEISMNFNGAYLHRNRRGYRKVCRILRRQRALRNKR